MKTREESTESHEVITAKMISNKINVQLLLENQGLSRSQGDLVHFANSGTATETKP